MHRSTYSIGFAILLLGGILALSTLPINDIQSNQFDEDMEAYMEWAHMAPPPVDSNLIFPPTKSCSGCHGFDPLGQAMIDDNGKDVNIHDDWQSTMMANAAKDPFWRAKVSHETTINPMHAEGLETKCTSCHAPQGHYTAILRGATNYSMQEMIADTLALEGVSCGACHQIKSAGLGQTFSGEVNYDTNRYVFGPYIDPFTQPMKSFVGFTPLYSPHINDAGICAGCHTLVTQTVDLDGDYTGTTFVEQATYHEWLNSRYEVENITCQECHMPRIPDSIVISANYAFLDGRSPYGLHELAGANTYMLEMLKLNAASLDIDVAPEYFDSTITATLRLLQEETLDLSLSHDTTLFDTAYFNLELANLAGHKFPSGYPARKAFIEFLLLSTEGDTLFHSGKTNSQYELEEEDLIYEPHYDKIVAEDQVQIYEMILFDVNEDLTTVLERAATTPKDNRLAPQGFSKTHNTYDTTRIEGLADLDPNFNVKDNLEGSGTDEIQYAIPLNGYQGYLRVEAFVHYQSIPPKWTQEIFTISTPEIDTFKQMYQALAPEPVLMGMRQLDSIFVEPVSSISRLNPESLTVFPNPTSDQIYIQTATNVSIQRLDVFDLKGNLIQTSDNQRVISLPEQKGIYLLRILTNKGQHTERIIRY